MMWQLFMAKRQHILYVFFHRHMKEAV